MMIGTSDVSRAKVFPFHNAVAVQFFRRLKSLAMQIPL